MCPSHKETPQLSSAFFFLKDLTGYPDHRQCPQIDLFKMITGDWFIWACQTHVSTQEQQKKQEIKNITK